MWFGVLLSSQIEEDLKPFPTINLDKWRRALVEKHSDGHFAHYTIMKNKVCVCVCVCVCEYMRACVNVCACVLACVHGCACVLACVCTY